MKVPRIVSKFIYLIFASIIALFIALAGNIANFSHQEDVKRNTFAVSSCDESYQMCTDAWVAVNRIKSNSTDIETINQCDRALVCIGQAKDVIMKTKIALGHN